MLYNLMYLNLFAWIIVCIWNKKNLKIKKTFRYGKIIKKKEPQPKKTLQKYIDLNQVKKMTRIFWRRKYFIESNCKIIWTPKFHCELNPIEGKPLNILSKLFLIENIYFIKCLGLWCDSKA